MPIPVLTVEQMREWEQATWATGVTEEEVIQRVGEVLAGRILGQTQPGDSVLILAGKGHNGDDARAAIPHLEARTVETLNVADPQADVVQLKRLLRQKPALVVDGLFGIGLDRPLDPDWQQLINILNDANRPVLSVDVPSGLDVRTGQIMSAAVAAQTTLTVGAPKTGMLTSEAVDRVGRIEVAENVGLVPHRQKSELQWTVPGDFADFPPARPVSGHKGTFGHLSLVAGSLGYHGAAVLAARGAQRARPGLITLHTHQACYHAVAAQLQSVMVRPWTPEKMLEATARLVGPGLAVPEAERDLRSMVRRWWADVPEPLIIDATALDWLSLEEPLPGKATRVVTPHPGEAARLLSSTTESVQADRPGAVREISERFGGCWVVLKGHTTLVGRTDGPIFVNSSGGPSLAQGGSGDLLAGFLGGLLAQPVLQEDPSLVLRYAVWQHGACADDLDRARPNWTIEELAGTLGSVRTG